MRLRTVILTAVAVVGLLSGYAASAGAVSYTLGDQDFANGQFVGGGVSQFNSASVGEPVPFDQIYGDDFGIPFSQSWTFNYPANPVAAATLTIGIVDHDSQASGAQVASFDLEGHDLTSVLNVLFEAYGGAQVEANVYSLVIPGSALGALADGSGTFNLILKGPGLQQGGPETSGNAAGVDFATLELTPVPEPSAALLLVTAMECLVTRRRVIRG